MRVQSDINQNPFGNFAKLKNISNQNKFVSKNLSFKALEAIIFDVDGTIVDNSPYHRDAWVQLCLNHKPKNVPVDFNAPITDESIKKIKDFLCNGKTNEVIKQLFGDVSPTEVEAYTKEKRHIYAILENDIQELKGLSQFLDSVRHIKKGIATSAAFNRVDSYLKKFKIAEHFNHENIIDESKIIKGKPHPEAYLKAADSLKVLPKDCLVFEDSNVGIKSALDAGMKVIGVATDLSKDSLTKLGAKLAIKDYTEINLPKILSLFEKEVSKIK